MTLENVYIIPHGDEIIDRPNRESNQLFNAIKKLTSGDQSETLLVLSPHGLRLSSSVAIINTEFLSADLELKTQRITRKYNTDRRVAQDLIGSDDFTQEVSFITSSGPLSVFPLDFGSIIPLHFFHQENVVSIGQPRIWDKPRLQKFGRNLARTVEDSDRKISVIISADQAHTHEASGPYGFAEESAPYEKLIEECVKNSNLSPLLDLSESFVDMAKPDSYWNMLILKGIMDETGLRSVMDYHYIEVYFGMLLGHLE